MTSEQRALCEDCGLPYEEFGIDLVLPDSHWSEIGGDEGTLLCPTCICRRASRLVKHSIRLDAVIVLHPYEAGVQCPDCPELLAGDEPQSGGLV